MIIIYDRLLDRRMDQFTKNYRSCVCMIDIHLDITDLHKSIRGKIKIQRKWRMRIHSPGARATAREGRGWRCKEP